MVYFVRVLLLSWVLGSTLGLMSHAVGNESDGSVQVNINTASAETLADVLVGVGLSKAEAIVAYRKQNGRFESAAELTHVKGIGERILVANEDRIEVAN